MVVRVRGSIGVILESGAGICVSAARLLYLTSARLCFLATATQTVTAWRYEELASAGRARGKLAKLDDALRLQLRPDPKYGDGGMDVLFLSVEQPDAAAADIVAQAAALGILELALQADRPGVESVSAPVAAAAASGGRTDGEWEADPDVDRGGAASGLLGRTSRLFRTAALSSTITNGLKPQTEPDLSADARARPPLHHPCRQLVPTPLRAQPWG